MDAKVIFNWFKSRIGTGYLNGSYGMEHLPTKREGYIFVDTENGFEDGISIDWDELEKEMDIWIANTFPKE